MLFRTRLLYIMVYIRPSKQHLLPPLKLLDFAWVVALNVAITLSKQSAMCVTRMMLGHGATSPAADDFSNRWMAVSTPTRVAPLTIRQSSNLNPAKSLRRVYTQTPSNSILQLSPMPCRKICKSYYFIMVENFICGLS